MKKYNVEIRKDCNEEFDNWADDFTEAENAEEAVELVKQWLIDNGYDPDDVENLMFRAIEVKEWYEESAEWEYFF